MPPLYFYSYIYDKILPLHGLTISDENMVANTKEGEYFKLHINIPGQPPQFELLLTEDCSIRTVTEKQMELNSDEFSSGSSNIL